jgi:hypothetical protein
VQSWGESLLILDTETTVDPTQRLMFGTFRQGHFDVHGAFVCLEEGLIYDEALLERDPEGYACLVAYADTHLPATTSLRHPRLSLWSRRQFLDDRLWPAIRGGTLIVGYNVGFDLTRLGTHAAPARGEMYEGGFSTTLYDYDAGDGQRRPNPFRPWFRIKPIDGRKAVMGFAKPMAASLQERQGGAGVGRLLDLRHLVTALTGKKLSLESAAAAFGLSDAKLPTEGHGVITPAYIDYNRHDVALTACLLEAVRVEWDRHPLQLAPEHVLSPATMAKGYLRSMGITPPAKKFSLPPEFLGMTMTAFFGGRTEVRVRRLPVPVVHTDFRSMYPTVNSLLGLWDIITAEALAAVPDTEAVQAWMAQLTREQCESPATWPRLRFFAKILPQGDILPVRATYDPTRQGTCIGVNPLTSDTPIWAAGPDCVASFLLTGRVPRILETVRLVPSGQQEGLKPISLRGLPIDPAKEDFFRRVIEMRAEVRGRPDLPKEERHRLAQFLKVLANSGSYGIFAELIAHPQRATPAPATLYGLDGGVPIATRAVEDPGEFWFPPLAALTTAGARLMLALLERRVTELGGHIAFGDTDSAAIIATKRGGLVPCPGGPHRLRDGREAIQALRWDQVQQVVDAFAALNPYDRERVPGSILRLEDHNFTRTGRRRQLWAFAISAKRYALFTRGPHGRITVVSAKEHGLGHLLSPLTAGHSGRAWIPMIWEAFIREALGEPLQLPSWVDRPAVTRITVSTTALWRAYDTWNAGKPYADQVKPMNFALSVTVAAGGHPAGADPTRFHLLAPFERDPARWLTMEYTERNGGTRHCIGVGRGTPGNRVQVKSIRDVVLEYRVHPEPKSLGPDGRPCGRATIGLLKRRPVRLGGIVYIGKESNALEQVEQGLVHDITEVQPRQSAPGGSAWDLVVRPAIGRMPLDRLVAATGKTTRHLRYLREGKRRPSPELATRLTREATRWARSLLKRKRMTPQDRSVAEALLQHGSPSGIEAMISGASGVRAGRRRLPESPAPKPERRPPEA